MSKLFIGGDKNKITKKKKKKNQQQIIKTTFYIRQNKGKIKGRIVKEIQKLFEESEKKKKNERLVKERITVIKTTIYCWMNMLITLNFT